MKMELLFLAIVLCACGAQRVSQDESYDRLAITTYKNKYDENNKLLEVQSITASHAYENGEMINLTDDKRIHYYKYINDDEFIIERRSEVSGDIEIVKYSPKMEESLTLNAQRDTVYYSLREYYDNSKSKLVYFRYKNNIYLMDERNDYEEKNEYDKNGNHIKRVQCYFDTNKKEITYFFKNLSYDEVKKRVPCKKENCNIICYIEKMEGDTLVRQEVINGILDNIEKTIIEGNRKQKFRFTADMKLTDSFTELEIDGFDIYIHRSVQTNLTDSIYYKKGKEVRRAYISDMFKSVVTSKYDVQGNIIEIVEKVKDFNLQDGDELIDEMLQVVKENEKKKANKNTHK
ncbi:hypothetical protein [Bacteroides sp.]